jgi:hypothetical protein
MHCSLFKFTLAVNSPRLFWKVLIFKFLPSTSETLLCSTLAPQVKIIPLLDAFQLLMLFAGTLTYLESELFFLIILSRVSVDYIRRVLD